MTALFVLSNHGFDVISGLCCNFVYSALNLPTNSCADKDARWPNVAPTDRICHVAHALHLPSRFDFDMHHDYRAPALDPGTTHLAFQTTAR